MLPSPCAASAPATHPACEPCRTAQPWIALRPLSLREGRVVAMLVAVWVLNIFDYAHTITGLSSGLVEECNPLALRVFAHGPLALLAYKALLVAGASVGMFCARRHRLTEFMLGLVIVVLAVVMLRWTAVYELYDMTLRLAPPGYNAF